MGKLKQMFKKWLERYLFTLKALFKTRPYWFVMILYAFTGIMLGRHTLLMNISIVAITLVIVCVGLFPVLLSTLFYKVINEEMKKAQTAKK